MKKNKTTRPSRIAFIYIIGIIYLIVLLGNQITISRHGVRNNRKKY